MPHLPKALRRLIIVAAFLVLLVAYLVLSRRNQPSPYPDIVFIEDLPGATDRYVSFTPVLKDDPSVKVGPVVGADYGRIHFEDVDKDGIKEAIIETQLPLIDFGEFYSDTRTVLRYLPDADGKPRMEEITFEQRGHREW